MGCALVAFSLMLLSARAGNAEHVPGEALVKFMEGVTPEKIREFEEEWQLERLGLIRSIQLYHYRAEGEANIEILVPELEADYRVDRVELNLLRHTNSLTQPSDPHFDYLWHLKNHGQVVNGWRAASGIDIQWLEAMEIYDPKEPVIVAVLDSGVAADHPELLGTTYEDTAIWFNRAEVDGRDGYDDDGNGFVDDRWGWDFYDNDNLPLDENGHGTLVASIIGGIADNGVEGVGICPDVKIMSLRVGDDLGNVSSFAWMSAMEYAAANGARILNCSFGGPGYSQFGQEMIWTMEDQDILVVSAAGNNGEDNDLSPQYPASYHGSNLLSIASVDPLGNLSYFSNYGRDSVDLAAPGTSIFGAGISRKTHYLEDFDGQTDGWTTYPMEDNVSSFENWALYEYEPGNFALADSVSSTGVLAYYESWTHTVAESPKIDLYGLNGPLLEFDIGFQLEEQWWVFDTDLLFVEASLNGYDWHHLTTIYGSGASGQIREERIDLSRFENQEIYIRFRLLTDYWSNYLGVLIDNFQITEVKTFEYSGVEHQFNNGTSFAAPVVSGVAALLLADRPELRVMDVDFLLFISAFIDPHPSLEEKLVTEGIVNAYNALALAEHYSMTLTRYYFDSFDAGGEFRAHPWLGFISLTELFNYSDWIYQVPHGWVYSHYDTDSSSYCYLEDFGWVWISENTSPWGYLMKERRWRMF